MNYPAIVEERYSERELMRERFSRPVDYGRVFLEHVHKMRPEYWEHQHVMFSVWTSYLKMIQGSEDAIRSRMRTRLRREVMMNFDFVVPAGKLCYHKLEGDISAVQR